MGTIKLNPLNKFSSFKLVTKIIILKVFKPFLIEKLTKMEDIFVL